jgi:hypothetical protein
MIHPIALIAQLIWSPKCLSSALLFVVFVYQIDHNLHHLRHDILCSKMEHVLELLSYPFYTASLRPVTGQVRTDMGRIM